MAAAAGRTTRTSTAAARRSEEGAIGGTTINWLMYAPAVGLALLVVAFRLLRPAYPVPQTPGIVVVTGTSSGIGNAVATHLAGKGYHVLAGVRRPESMDAWKRVGNPNITPVKLDVSDPADIQAVVGSVQRLKKQWNVKLAGVVGNAGLGFHMPIEYHNIKDIQRMFDVNFFGNVALTQAFMPLIREDKARIVFTSSLAGRITQPKEGIYASSKAALESLGDALRQELFPYQVSVSLVEPGFVATPILTKILDSEEVGNSTAAAKTYPRLYTDKYFRIFERGMGSAGPPEKVANVVYRALTDKRPKTRYSTTNFLTIPTWLALRVKQLLPDRLFDKIVA